MSKHPDYFALAVGLAMVHAAELGVKGFELPTTPGQLAQVGTGGELPAIVSPLKQFAGEGVEVTPCSGGTLLSSPAIHSGRLIEDLINTVEARMK